MPATTATLRTYLGIDPATTNDEEALAMAVDAANDLVATFRPDLTVLLNPLDFPAVPEGQWAPRAEQAANVEAARLYGRRGSVQGVAAFADLGVSLLPRLDPEVRSLLELGEYQRSVVS
jgi:hypothetical protein